MVLILNHGAAFEVKDRETAEYTQEDGERESCFKTNKFDVPLRQCVSANSFATSSQKRSTMILHLEFLLFVHFLLPSCTLCTSIKRWFVMQWYNVLRASNDEFSAFFFLKKWSCDIGPHRGLVCVRFLLRLEKVLFHVVLLHFFSFCFVCLFCFHKCIYSTIQIA